MHCLTLSILADTHPLLLFMPSWWSRPLWYVHCPSPSHLPLHCRKNALSSLFCRLAHPGMYALMFLSHGHSPTLPSHECSATSPSPSSPSCSILLTLACTLHQHTPSPSPPSCSISLTLACTWSPACSLLFVLTSTHPIPYFHMHMTVCMFVSILTL